MTISRQMHVPLPWNIQFNGDRRTIVSMLPSDGVKKSFLGPESAHHLEHIGEKV